MNYVKLDTELHREGFSFRANLKIESRVTGIFGPSGSGKTTFMHLLAGLQKPDKGTIEICNEQFVNSDTRTFIPAHRRGVGYVFQEGRLFPHLNVIQNLRYGWKKNTHSKAYFDEIIDLLELRDLLHSHPAQLSGGQKQRVAIGRALMSNARLLLLDEPFTALDVSLKKQVIGLLNRMIRHLNIPVIIVSHDLKDLLMLTQQIILIKNGVPEAPASYLELINNRKLLNFNGWVTNYYNIIDGTIRKNLPEKGITQVNTGTGGPILHIECDACIFEVNDPVKISIRGADVALSLAPFKDISIQNQLPGTIESVFQHRSHLVCIVNCGIRIISRITIDSGANLKLEAGKPVYCLIKSLAIETYL